MTTSTRSPTVNNRFEVMAYTIVQEVRKKEPPVPTARMCNVLDG